MTPKAQTAALFIVLLAMLPFAVHAEQRFTYQCDGVETADGGDDIHTQERVTRFYTLYVEGSRGRWFNWEEHIWYPIHAITKDTFQLSSDSDRGVSWTFSIQRADGAWNEQHAGGGATTVTTGKCTLVRLREPPSPEPSRRQ